MPELTEIDIGNGHVLCVCEAHQLESCHHCGFEFTEMNEESRSQKQMEDAENAPIGSDLLPRGTVIRAKPMGADPPQRDFVATIGGVMNGDPHDFGDDIQCYVAKDKRNSSERFLIEVEEVHESWLLEGMTFDQVRRIIHNDHEDDSSE